MCVIWNIGTEGCERLAYCGIATNLVTYLTNKLHEGNVSAATSVTTWQGTCYLTPLIGAVLADAYWGRYWTIAAFSTIYFIVSIPYVYSSFNYITNNWSHVLTHIFMSLKPTKLYLWFSFLFHFVVSSIILHDQLRSIILALILFRMDVQLSSSGFAEQSLVVWEWSHTSNL